MQDISFSLVFPTRERVNLLELLFDSLKETTNNPKKIEIIPVVDDDDNDTISESERLKNIVSEFNCRFIFRQRTKKLNEDYINFAARQSFGKFVIVLNDDVLFKKKDWDIKGFDVLEKYLSDKPDRIVYGLTDDGMDNVRKSQRGIEYSGFPVLSKEAISVLGYAMHPKFNSWSADIHLYPIYKSVNRICNLRNEICTFHNSHHTNQRERDNINRHVESIQGGSGPSQNDNINDINKLKLAIGQQLLSIPTSKPTSLPRTSGHLIGQNPSQRTAQYLRRISSLNQRRR